VIVYDILCIFVKRQANSNNHVSPMININGNSDLKQSPIKNW